MDDWKTHHQLDWRPEVCKFSPLTTGKLKEAITAQLRELPAARGPQVQLFDECGEVVRRTVTTISWQQNLPLMKAPSVCHLVVSCEYKFLASALRLKVVACAYSEL